MGIIIAESVDKLFHPVSVDGSAIAWTAGVGVVINALTAWLFMKDKDKDLNVKGAYLHMAADALVSVGVVVSGIIITYTEWSIIDPIIGLGITVIIIVSTCVQEILRKTMFLTPRPGPVLYFRLYITRR